ncbi:unnamed protein product [Acanthoscelides obtectus]|uniref:RING-type domain-containing protein n=2 Tax=Acanthoscelides obtectus TaxID=200917 RepID=A0A9P0PCK5_ACAOB|nr:unnamed protein product [Acanthoscelides obtectus]CAK1620965.1 E3 ubiquitin-protein ligase RNF216 [Acanthoscelides obtectus]
MAEAVVDHDEHVTDFEDIVARLTDAFPKLSVGVIRKVAASCRRDTVQMVIQLSAIEVDEQRKAEVEESRALMPETEQASTSGVGHQKRGTSIKSQVKKYTSGFNIEEFLAMFPNPEETFRNPERGEDVLDLTTADYVERFFMNKYPSIYKSHISFLLYQGSKRQPKCKSLLKVDEELQQAEQTGEQVMKCRRKPTTMRVDPGEDIRLLQELAYLEHRTDILDCKLKKQQEEADRRKIAKENGLSVSCQCCFADDLFPEEVYSCTNDCCFCAECIRKSCELKLGEGDIQFPCLADCGAQFAWKTLQAALPPTLLSKLSQRYTESEIRAAGLKVDSCPFCNFPNTIDEEYTLFQCLNPKCLKETCRLCKELNHLPLRCDEVEKDEDVKARVHVENKMTEAILRTCHRCQRKFVKEEDGCNKITCICGAVSCYVCNKPVTGYDHFNGLGGSQYEKCPLYVDMLALQQRELTAAADEAKKQVGPNRLKSDPSIDLDKYFEHKRQTTAQPRWMQEPIPPPNPREPEVPRQRRMMLPAQQQRDEPRVAREYLEVLPVLNMRIPRPARPPPNPREPEVPRQRRVMLPAQQQRDEPRVARENLEAPPVPNMRIPRRATRHTNQDQPQAP